MLLVTAAAAPGPVCGNLSRHPGDAAPQLNRLPLHVERQLALSEVKAHGLHGPCPMVGLPRSVEVSFAVGSVAMFVATLVAIPVFLVRIPDDYFARPRRSCSFGVRVLRAIAGVTLIALGGAMLVLPGQGLLTILVGLSVLDLPIKEQVINRLLRLPKVRHAVDSIRHKAGKGSLLLPGACDGGAAA
jgi:hypothetical protein